MKILVSIDDTDTMKMDGIEVRGTGELAGLIKQAIEEYGWGSCEPITRHQLLIHPGIPYTSHNSSMCFEAEIEQAFLEPLIDFASDFLANESTPDSDPGLCVAVTDRISRPGWLIAFGYMAKNYVLNKQEAYDLAEKLGIHLSEHGGTGQGVIGALAGAGLRLSGNDGRFKGKLKIKAENSIIKAGDICSQVKVDMVKCLEEGIVLQYDDMVVLGDHIKPVWLYGKSVLLVHAINEDTVTQAHWQTYSKRQLKDF
ncbi:MAG: hypothetical protein CVU90_10390 [Firmicutes bacterium HGW-Firmicutes-15]|nr:MAG: hypothetical protein CVU90_10390 [Firmicutes bacterium HGW-Firmicutes-15]